MSSKRQQVAMVFTMMYAWMLVFFFGALISKTFTYYPNVFYDVPRSLDIASGFAVRVGPGDFFPPIGLLTMFLAITSLILVWPWAVVRYLILVSLLMFIGEFLFSVLFFWPRNTIMFVEGTDVHSASYLKQTARQFVVGHWLRVIISAIVSVVGFVGFAKFYRFKIKSSVTAGGTVTECQLLF